MFLFRDKHPQSKNSILKFTQDVASANKEKKLCGEKRKTSFASVLMVVSFTSLNKCSTPVDRSYENAISNGDERS